MDILAAHGLAMVVVMVATAKALAHIKSAAEAVLVVILVMAAMVRPVQLVKRGMVKVVAVADQWLTQVDTLAAAVGSAFMDKAQMESAA
jgi:hypothetical protein